MSRPMATFVCPPSHEEQCLKNHMPCDLLRFQIVWKHHGNSDGIVHLHSMTLFKHVVNICQPIESMFESILQSNYDISKQPHLITSERGKPDNPF